ncbi:MAG: hypothetical protein EZS28_020759 [Streblomastix strix]|uniref:Uncharacterized protein n=1 Tax=Streblomastix strix TaxID=222440 RepID=A0A5J4VM73_9EUKA|nr:MAG: hypothetical protein EZS28_020759 [Streblomastix strix]
MGLKDKAVSQPIERMRLASELHQEKPAQIIGAHSALSDINQGCKYERMWNHATNQQQFGLTKMRRKMPQELDTEIQLSTRVSLRTLRNTAVRKTISNGQNPFNEIENRHYYNQFQHQQTNEA